MKTGRRVADPAKKTLAGTYRADRHATIVELAPSPKSVPIPPSYLTTSREAMLVWEEEYARVVAVGVTEADSSLFARYCAMEAAFRGSVLAGDPPSAALTTELRRSAELLGIAGLRSRLAKLGTGAAEQKPAFTVRPK